jgi:beta-glucanase (GH16 family)
MIKLPVALVIISFCFASMAQERNLVWYDQFNGPSIDTSVWSFEHGPSNDNVQFYTNRTQNAVVADGELQLIALKESYSGYNFTSALVRTKNSLNWRYGRIEARIKLPGSNGFVPAFWILPSDDRYGWWPNSGEIDIMEHPTNQLDKIYGTVHTGTYNSFTGSGSKGSIIQIPDAETEFHIYAIEWTEEQVDFYVDDQKYFTFNNEHSGPGTWPFDQPFYIILNLAVGGGWVGSPDNATIFPAKMEIDYVRVYQYQNDMSINGKDFLLYNKHGISYTVPEISGADYIWKVPGHAQIVSGENTNRIDVDYGILGGAISSTMNTPSGSVEMKFPVHVSSNLIKNPGFEYGVKYWNKTVAYPGKGEFAITTQETHSGSYSVAVSVESPGTNAWDISLTNNDILIEKGKTYHLSFWAKSDNDVNSINASVINSSDFTFYGHKTFTFSKNWSQYQLDFAASTTHSGSVNLDLGNQAGLYFFDDFVLTTPELSDLNLVKNADFSDGMDPWTMKASWPALASDTILDGECTIRVDNEGTNPWDINLGQAGIQIQQDKEYILSFDAHASSPRQFSAFVGKSSDPWTVYSGSHIFSPVSEMETYSFSFIMKELTDNNARVGFDVGTFLPDVSFDNVVLHEKTISTGVNDLLNTNDGPLKLYQIYPNPVNWNTTIAYKLSESCQVEVKIFNNLGLEVETLMDDFQVAGMHQVMWQPGNLPDGTYYSRLRAGNHSLTKMIIRLSEH